VALARYQGQAHELEVPWTDDLAARFHDVHEARNGSRDEARAVEVVTVRARGIGGRAAPARALSPERPGDGAAARVERARVVMDRGVVDAWVVDRDRLAPGDRVDGASIIIDGTATTVVPPGYVARVDGLANLILERAT
jgi:N-methylhydantoinase A/oxoprolinase/acetone carboxylase beta subunit